MKSDGPITSNGIHPSTQPPKKPEAAAPATPAKAPDEGKGNLFYPKQLGLRGAPKT